MVRMAVDERGGRDAGGAHGDLVAGPGLLGHGLVKLPGDRTRVGENRFHVGRDADDFAPLGGLNAGLREAAADGVFIAKQARGHGLADDEDLRGGQGVARVEGTAGEHPGADGFEIAGTDAIDDRGGFLAAFGKFAAPDDISAGVIPGEEGGEGGDAGGGDPGQGFQAFHGETVEGGDPVRVGVAGGGEDDVAGDEVLGLPTGPAVIQLIEAMSHYQLSRGWGSLPIDVV